MMVFFLSFLTSFLLLHIIAPSTHASVHEEALSMYFDNGDFDGGNDLEVFATASENDEPYAKCGDCYCIPDSDNGTCPSPLNYFSSLYDYDSANRRSGVNDEWAAKIGRFQTQVPTNGYSISCDPYTDEACETVPAQDDDILALDDVAVCGIHYTSAGNSLQKQCPTQYELVSFKSREEALVAGAHITHAGACGLCSTTQDLAVYLIYPDMTNQASKCVSEALVDEALGMLCFRNLGLTEGCAKIWLYNGYNTSRQCFSVCILERLYHTPNNGPPPTCDLNECLQCDEDKSGPLFKKFAARTNRRSGLLSIIARPCQDIVRYIHPNPCPAT